MYSFLPHWSLSTVRYFILPVLSSIILFLPLISFLLSFFFPCRFLLACYFIYFSLQGFGYLLYFFVKSVAAILSFSCSPIIILIFQSSSMFFMLWHNINVVYCIICSAGHSLASINIHVYVVLTVKLNILYKTIPSITSIFLALFFLSLLCYVSPCFYLIYQCWY